MMILTELMTMVEKPLCGSHYIKMLIRASNGITKRFVKNCLFKFLLSILANKTVSHKGIFNLIPKPFWKHNSSLEFTRLESF